MTPAGLSFEDFAQRMLLLLDQGRFVATYKFAVLLAMLDVLAETAAGGRAPATISTRDLAEKVVAIYWTHTLPFDDIPPLRQNQTGQAEVVGRIAKFRQQTVGDATLPAHRARLAQPQRFERLISFAEWKLVEMPLGRLQLVGSESDPFIYELGWSEPVTQSVVQSERFKGELVLSPGAGDHLLRMTPLLRPLVQRTWALTVARFNDLDTASLDTYLFGASRISLAPAAPGLRELAEDRCFYCAETVKARAQIDHFIPWARHIDNAIENLVFAHDSCNSAKSAFLAAEGHVERWLTRMRDPDSRDALAALAEEARWESRPLITEAIGAATYLVLPTSYKLWTRGKEFATVDSARLHAAFGQADAAAP